ncbi:MAG: type I restriction-modification system subunit M N-terminal domain-containing protein, partial [Thiolinea sp.]
MNSTIRQDEINKALWAACDTFRGTISADTYKDFILTMLFLKYLSDVWQDHYEHYQQEYGDEPDLIVELMQNERFTLPEISLTDDEGKVTDIFRADFYSLYDRRHTPGNGERFDMVLHAIEEANGTKLNNVFQDISFNTNKLGDEKEKNDVLRFLLEDFASPVLNLRPSRVGDLD